MVKKKNNRSVDKCCSNCANLLPCGEGDHVCEEDPTRIVLEDYLPSDDYFWCEGRKWKEQ